ncbi:hypothetical protein WFM01_17180 [Yersinia enterocolitica]
MLRLVSCLPVDHQYQNGLPGNFAAFYQHDMLVNAAICSALRWVPKAKLNSLLH